MSNNTTIIIPTYKRHHQLERLLEYYSDYRFPILVADSTPNAFPLSKKYKNVKYYHYPNLSYSKKLPQIYKKVKTKYVLFCADDDFVIPSAILSCTAFLEKHPDYNSAHGHYIFFENKKGKLTSYPFYLGSIDLDINADTASQRVLQLLSSYMQLLYAVTKTSDIKQVFKNLNSNPGIKNDNLVEIFQAIILCINGKSKTLPILYCAREVTPNSARTHTDDLDAFYIKPKYAKEYQVWLTTLTNHLAKKSHLPQAKAKEHLLEALNMYLKNSSMYVPFLKISILNIQRALNKYSFGLAKKIYNLILPSPIQNNVNKHGFSKKAGKQEFKIIKSYIEKFPL